MIADIMSHFNVIFCTSFISSHLNNEAVKENRTQQTPAFADNFAHPSQTWKNPVLGSMQSLLQISNLV